MADPDFCELAELLLVEVGVWLAAKPTKIMHSKTNQVNRDVFFGAFAPHLGHVLALVLTSSPHSLHFTNAIDRSFPLNELL